MMRSFCCYGTSGKTKAERKGKGIVKPLWIEIAQLAEFNKRSSRPPESLRPVN